MLSSAILISPCEESMLRTALSLFLAAVIGSISSAQQPLRGIETGDLDRSVQPCDNFYDFANGTWRANNPIPASMDRWSRLWQAGEVNNEHLRLILEDISARPNLAPGTPAQLIGDFYAACTDTK